MWKKPDDGAIGPPNLASNATPDLTSLGESLVESLTREQFKEADFAVDPKKVPPIVKNQPLPLRSMEMYTEAISEFTKNATTFIEQLPLLTKARSAYEEAMRATAEMRKVLDAGEERLRTLMTQLEQELNIAASRSVPDKKNPEPTKFERTLRADARVGRVSRWP
jgi:hypothetical protein